MLNTPSSSFLLSTSASGQIQNVAVVVSRNNRQKAVQWLTDVLWTVELLAAQPNIGAIYRLENPQLHSLRRYRVRNHRAYWIYFRPFASGNGIEVFAVLHERQNIGEQLEEALEL